MPVWDHFYDVVTLHLWYCLHIAGHELHGGPFFAKSAAQAACFAACREHRSRRCQIMHSLKSALDSNVRGTEGDPRGATLATLS